MIDSRARWCHFGLVLGAVALVGSLVAPALLALQSDARPAGGAAVDPRSANPYTHWSRAWEVAVRPAGDLLAGGSTDQPRIRLWKLPSLEEIRTFGSHAHSIEALVWSPDGKLLASGSRDRTVKIWDPEAGAELHALTGHDDWVWDLAWRPDGSLLASAAYDGKIKLWRPREGVLERTIEASTLPLFAVAWSPDGRLLAAAGRDGIVRGWEDLAGAPSWSFAAHPTGVACMRWAGDRRLVTAGWDRSIRVWSVAERRMELELTGHRGSIHKLVVSPDGGLVATLGADRTMRIWDLQRGAELRAVASRSQGMRSVDWSRDGSWLVTVEWKMSQIRLLDTRDWSELSSASGS